MSFAQKRMTIESGATVPSQKPESKRDAMKRKIEGLSNDEIRRRIEKRYEARGALMQHAISYLMTNIILWAIWLFTVTSFPWPLFVTGFWGIGLLSHFVDYHNKHGKGAQKRQEEIEAEVMRQLEFERAQEILRSRRQYDEQIDGADVYELDNYKQRGLRLSDDGELVDLELWEDDEEVEKRDTL